MISDKDRIILNHLRKNARANLTDIAKMTGMPVSTVHSRVKTNEKGLVKKHTALIDFSKLGFHAKTAIAIKVGIQDRNRLLEFLKQHANVNTLYRINYGFDFLIEVIYPNVSQMEDFITEMESSFDIQEKHFFNIIEDIKLEEFKI